MEVDVTAVLARVHRDEWAALLATITGQVGGDIALAEDAVQEAFAQAATEWRARGVPDRPAGWLTVTARRRAIDLLRRDQTRSRYHEVYGRMEATAGGDDDDESSATLAANGASSAVHDDRLRMIFTCCHPALAIEARLALTLRTLGGLEVPEIARAFLVNEATMFQRITRAKRKLLVAGVGYKVPSENDLPERLAGVLRVIYVIFTEGHSATSGTDLIRTDLCDEAIRLARLLTQLCPDEAEVLGLLALLVLTDARRPSRTSSAGPPVSLTDQDRSQWDRQAIAEGIAVLDRALTLSAPGSYQIQAAIAALHAEAPDIDATDWHQIALLYAELERIEPTPVVTVNRAIAVGRHAGAARGLAVLAGLSDDDRMAGYQPYYAARAELLVEVGDLRGASAAYASAIELAGNPSEREALRARAAAAASRLADHTRSML